jgi:beta-lactamase superfamily II metal-dependent hydrolase
MRKLTVFWVTVLFLLALTVTAYARFPDIPSGATYETAVRVLADLGVFRGDANGNFNPDNSMTRAEFAAVVVGFVGESGRAAGITTSGFSDVDAGHWAAGVIAVVVDMGFMSGVGDGLFAPSNTLTYEQAVAVLVNVSGHNDAVKELGSVWPDSFISVANNLGITANTSVNVGEQVKRSTVAVLLYNTHIILSGSDSVQPGGELRAIFIDVGQGDSTLIILPTGETVLIDTGERQDASAVIVQLRNNGIQTINYLILTHPHLDHIGGAPVIINGFDVKSVWMPDTTHTTQAFERLLNAIAGKGLNIDIAQAGTILFDNGVNLRGEFVAPNASRYSNLNDWSAILRVEFGNTALIVTGDAESVSENEIVRAGHNV